ncbi:hypothetical protein D1818_02110 [Aquimarina sp. BL5]|uniref:hypothetical protein n=1 Tax=unclassified Aquimarina TaxID=2627091 RepID=UPI000D693F39|nr:MULTISPECIES: hypothetical protein [unclassified Aquimarina]AXT49672.1 hypothetical protein D1818_02110 [Aquimarina sp. BL5]RKM89762.1 hypothetical protein D7036_24480 [Aquimarina sp. BL5]
MLSELSKQELIDKVISLSNIRKSQASKLKELEDALIIRNIKVQSQESIINSLQNEKKNNVLDHYENLLRDYRLEISDLREEIESWKLRYINKNIKKK